MLGEITIKNKLKKRRLEQFQGSTGARKTKLHKQSKEEGAALEMKKKKKKKKKNEGNEFMVSKLRTGGGVCSLQTGVINTSATNPYGD